MFAFNGFNILNLSYNFILTLSLTTISFFIIFRTKYKYLFLAIFFILQTIYYLGNITYFQYFHNYLYIGNLIGNITEGGEVISNLAIPLYFEQLLILIDLPIIIYIFYKQHDIKLQSNYKFQILMPIIIFISLISTSIYNKNSPYHIFQDKWAGIIEIIQKFGLFALQITDWKLTDTSKIEFKYGDVLEVKNLNGVVKAKKILS